MQWMNAPAPFRKKPLIKIVADFMQIILCGPFDDDEPIPYGRCSCSYACGSRERVRGDASLVEMCASLSAPPRLYLLFYLQSKKTISSNILLKYNTSYAKNK